MDVISNSPIKESIRQHYYTIAANKQRQINEQLNRECLLVQDGANDKIEKNASKKIPNLFYFLGGFTIITVITIVLAYGSGIVADTFSIFALLLLAVGLINNRKRNIRIDAEEIRIRNEIDDKIQQLKNNAESQINVLYDEADRQTKKDIEEYDAEVKKNCQIILKKSDEFIPMIDHNVMMFQRMISHADSASNRKFIEADFIFRVELYGICYKYQSTYSNPMDDFNFDKQRYRNLTTNEEREGLARAITKMTVEKMKGLYPPNSLNIIVSHIDAEVTLHFRAANKNYMPPRNIY